MRLLGLETSLPLPGQAQPVRSLGTVSGSEESAPPLLPAGRPFPQLILLPLPSGELVTGNTRPFPLRLQELSNKKALQMQ